MVSAADLIAAARASRVSKVDIGGDGFYVRRLGATAVMEISQRARAGNALGVHEWLVLGVCNEDGSPFFTADEAREYAEESGLVSVRLADAIAEKAGLGGGDAAKNSEATPNG